MKKVICIILCLVCLCTCLSACGETEKQSTEIYKTYQKVSYSDFNDLLAEKGYTPIENTDNIKVKFKKSFSIEDGDCFSMLYYEFENINDAFTQFDTITDIYEVYDSEFAKYEKLNNYGYYMVKDGSLTTYVSFVDNTLLYALIYTEDADKQNTKRTELYNLINYLQYPIAQFPTFK